MGDRRGVRFNEEQNSRNSPLKARTLEINDKKSKKFRKFFLERSTRVFILFILFSTAIPFITFYYWIQKTNDDPQKLFTCVIDPSYRVQCGLYNITCSVVSCCYDPTINQCYHRIPASYNYRRNDEISYSPVLSTTPLFTKSLKKLMLTIRDINPDRTQIILHDSTTAIESNEISETNFVIKRDETLLGVEVLRKTTSEKLLTTFRGPLIASDGYWEWTIQLTTDKLVGLGEILFNSNETVTKIIYKNKNDHNTLPIFMAYLNGNFHAVVIEHMGLLEVSVLPSKLIILKSLAGSKIILNLYVGGSNPGDVLNQIRSFKSIPVPYWVLGAHICRDGLTNMDSALVEYKQFTAGESTVHYTSDCIHENLYFMLHGVPEMKNDVKRLIQELQEKSHFMLSVTPHIPRGTLYNKAVDLDLLYYNNITTLHGSYLEQDVAYPDYANQAIDVWMKDVGASFPGDKVDGFVLRDNWPVNEQNYFVNNTQFSYYTKDIAASLGKTIPLDAYSKTETFPLKHFLKHNQYGSNQAKAFKPILNGEFLMTSSYDYNTPDAALIQNVDISWSSLKKVITTTLYHSTFGSNLISIPICGSTKNYNKKLHEDLCMRWYILAATFPLFRISSELPRRDPSSLTTKFVKNVVTNAIKKRLQLLPYYYTTLNFEKILVKPMFYDFHFDNEVWNLDEQYMLGNALLVAQPVLPHTSRLQVYLPLDTGVWYEFWGGNKYDSNRWLTLDVVESDWVMFIRQGHIVPLRNAKGSSKVGSYGPDDTYTFAVALNCKETGECKSDGQLMLTSVFIKLEADQHAITISNVRRAKEDIGCDLLHNVWPRIIDSVMIYGMNNESITYSNFLPIDLCATELDDISINFFI